MKVVTLLLIALSLARPAAARAVPEALSRPTQWTVDGTVREALVVGPDQKSETAAPLVFVFHGHGGTMRSMAQKAFHKLWPEAIVVYPQGLPTSTTYDKEGLKAGWQPRVGANGDRDLKFFDTLLKSLRETYKIDDARVYAAGHSNGGIFTYLLWFARGDQFAALAPSAAVSIGIARERNIQPVPLMHLAGESDTIAPFTLQRRMMDAVKKVNRCDDKGTPWATSGDLVGTQYGSKNGAVFVSVISPGGHTFSDDAPGLIVKFFKEHKKK